MNGPVRTRIALGQNFFKSPQSAKTLLRHIDLSPADRVYDLGAGTGIVTRELLKTGAQIIAVERDPNLASRLRAGFAPRLQVVEDDLLRVAWQAPYKVVANLPYGVTAATLRRLLWDEPSPDEALLVLQREAAEKYAGVRHAAVALLPAPWFVLRIVHAFARDEFIPRPAVDSVALHIARREVPLLASEERPVWEALVRYAFARSKPNARQTFRNLISNLQWRLLCRDLNVAPDVRLTDLSRDAWLAIYRFTRDHIPEARQRLILPTRASWRMETAK